MISRRTVHFLVPERIDDPLQPSGGNSYDRRVCHGLAADGWAVHTHAVPGPWPWPDEAAHQGLNAALATPPDGALTLVDGLMASAVPDLLVPAGRRLRLVILVHMPIGRRADESYDRECAVLSAAAAIVTTSGWARGWLLAAYPLDPARVHTAPPGVDVAQRATGSGGGSNLLCVASVTSGKGHDVLVAALTRIGDLPWQCTCVGSVARAPSFVADLQRVIESAGLAERVVFTGPLTGRSLERSYAAADALVLPSRGETYGMVVTEALARGLPVLATDVGGIPEALGAASDGRRPGLLVPSDDVTALVGALRRWLCDAQLRADLRAAAMDRRNSLTGWSDTTDRVARVLLEVAA